MDGVILILIALIAVIYAAWHRLLAVWWRGSISLVMPGDRVLGAMVLTVAQMCAVGYVLGSVGWWNGATAGWTNVGMSLVVWYMGFGGGVESPDRLLWDDFKDIALGVRYGLKSPTLTLMTIMAGITVGILTWFALSQPAMAYDAWGYHTVKAVLLDMTGWIQPWYWDEGAGEAGRYIHGCAGYGVYAAEHKFTDFYPANDSVLQAYVLTFTHSIRLAQLVQMPFLVMMVLAVYRLVRRVVGGNVETAGVCGLAVVSLYTVTGQCWQGLSDVMVAGLLWAGYSTIMLKPTKWSMILSALACGLAVGTKLGAGYWVLGIMILSVIMTIKTRRP